MRPIQFKNTQGSTIPPHACMAIVSVAYEGLDLVFSVRRPRSSDIESGAFLFNGEVECRSGGGGRGLSEGFMPAFVDGDPDIGDVVGPVADQWYLSSSGTGFVVAGEDSEANPDTFIVQPKGGGGSPQEYGLYTLLADMAAAPARIKCDVRKLDGSTVFDQDIIDDAGTAAPQITGDQGLCVLHAGVWHVVEPSCVFEDPEDAVPFTPGSPETIDPDILPFP